MIRDMLSKDITQQELLNIYNANITDIGLPPRIYGFVYKYKNINNIFINRNLSYYKKKKTILHELAHIELNHLCNCRCESLAFYIENCDDEANEYIRNLEEL